jgi:hypothetical protein
MNFRILLCVQNRKWQERVINSSQQSSILSENEKLLIAKGTTAQNISVSSKHPQITGPLKSLNQHQKLSKAPVYQILAQVNVYNDTTHGILRTKLTIFTKISSHKVL